MTRDEFIQELEFTGWTPSKGRNNWYKEVLGVPRLFKVLPNRFKSFSKYDENWKFSTSFPYSDVIPIDTSEGAGLKLRGGTVIWRL